MTRLSQWAKRVTNDVHRALTRGNAVVVVNGDQLAAARAVLGREVRAFMNEYDNHDTDPRGTDAYLDEPCRYLNGLCLAGNHEWCEGCDCPCGHPGAAREPR